MSNTNDEIKLTPKQRKFVDEYLECGNGSEAYRRAYKKPKKQLLMQITKQSPPIHKHQIQAN